MLEENRLPPSFRITQALGETLSQVGFPLYRLEAERLIHAARKYTRLQDFDADTRFDQALSILCNSANEDAQLHFLGRMGIHAMFVSALCQRLIWVETQRLWPERLSRPLHSPMLVVGFPRSGTTLLHRLLSLAADARSLAAWEVQKPLAPINRQDDRRTRTHAQFRRIARLSPALTQKHPLYVDDPEEDFWLLNASLLSPTFHIFAPLDRYEKWLNLQDMSQPYRLWASMLSGFQASTPRSRLTLKSPAHTAHIDSAVAAIPNLGIVHIHRDPVTVVGSLNSLMHTLVAIVSKRRNPIELGQRNLQRLRQAGLQNKIARKKISGHVLDVHYNELQQDPVGLVQRIHRHFDLGFTDAHALAICDFLEQRPQHQHGHHPYSLDECGLTKEEVHAALGDLELESMNQYS